jgi:hypothetical protein
MRVSCVSYVYVYVLSGCIPYQLRDLTFGALLVAAPVTGFQPHISHRRCAEPRFT